MSEDLSTERIWERFGEDLSAFFRRRVRDEHLAADLLQETFVRIHRGVGALEDADRVLAWVYRVARNVLADHFRKSVHQPLDVEPASEPDAADENFDAEVQSWLWRLLDRIPETYREALQLTEIEGLTQREVGERLGLSLSGAKSRVQRGRALLKERILACCHLELDRRGHVVDYRRHGECPACQR